MAHAHVFRSSEAEWQPHPRLRGVRIKSLKNSRSFSQASVTLVDLDPGGEVEPHEHERGWESAYILSGSGVLTLPGGDVTLAPGDGVTVHPGTRHALRNTGGEPLRILAVHIPPMM